MNGQPHAHRVRFEPQYSYIQPCHHRVTYGDTSKIVWRRGPFLKWRMKRAVRVVIRRHDRGSVKARKDDLRKVAAVTSAMEIAPDPDLEQWASRAGKPKAEKPDPAVRQAH